MWTLGSIFPVFRLQDLVKVDILREKQQWTYDTLWYFTTSDKGNGQQTGACPPASLGRLPVRDVRAGVQDWAGVDPAPVLLPLLPVSRLSQEQEVMSTARSYTVIQSWEDSKLSWLTASTTTATTRTSHRNRLTTWEPKSTQSPGWQNARTYRDPNS